MAFAEQAWPFDSDASYFVRIHRDSTLVAPFLKQLELESEMIIAYEHTEEANRIHCHFLILNYKKTRRTLRDRIIRNFDITRGNEVFSIKSTTGAVIMDIERCIVYMTKGKYDPFCSPFGAGYNDYLKSQYENMQEVPKLTFLQEMWLEWAVSDHNPTMVVEYHEDIGENIPRKPTYNEVRNKALAFSIGKYDGFCSTAAFNLCKQLTNTYCYRNKISFTV